MFSDPLFMTIIGCILFMLLIGLVGNAQYSYRIRQLKDALAQYSLREQDWEKGIPHHEMLSDMIEEYRTQRLAGVEYLNSQALIERHFNRITIRIMGIFPVSIGNWDRFLSFLSAGMVMIGLLGTFIGLTTALYSMQEILFGFGNDVSGELSVPLIISAISKPFEGMSFAFITSIFGIGASLLLSGFTSGALGRGIGGNPIALKADFLTECEDFLDNRYLAYLEGLKPKGSMEEIMDRLSQKLRESFEQSIAHFADSIVTMTARIDESVHGIEEMLKKQETIIHAFDQGSTQLVKFGQTMERTVKELVENNRDSASQIDRLGGQVERLHEAITKLGDHTMDSARSLEAIVESATKNLEEERRSSRDLIGQIEMLHKQIEESSKQQTLFNQQVMQGQLQKMKESFEQMRKDLQMQKEQEQRMGMEVQQQTLRQLEQAFYKIDQTLVERQRNNQQQLQQMIMELSNLIRQQGDLGQKTLESHRFLIERLPAISRSAEEFSRSVENLDRSLSEFLERMRREISTLLSQILDSDRKYAPAMDANREFREMIREMEGMRHILEREFQQSHRFAYEIQQLVEAIYEAGRSTLRRQDSRFIDGRPSTINRQEREPYERMRDEGMRR